MSALIRSVVLKVASRCNLNCGYCYLYNHQDKSIFQQPKIIREDVFATLLERMVNHCDRHGHRMGITFHGGEPTLLGMERFEELILRARARLGDRLNGLSVQTNATLIDDDWASMLFRNDLSVGVSLDGPAEIHDRMRVTHSGGGSHLEAVRGIEALRRAGVSVRVLCVVNPNTDGSASYRYFRSLGLTWIDFLLPDISHDSKTAFYGPGPHPVADYLLPILDAWQSEDDPNVMIPVFWDLFSRLMGSERSSTDCFGNPAMTYVIVNTDGSIEPLDALKVCDEGMTRTEFNVLRNSFDELTSRPSLLADALRGRFAPCAECKSCRYGTVCAGGYLPHRYRRENGFDNPSVWCDDIKLVLDRMVEIIARSGINEASAPPSAFAMESMHFQ